MTGRSKVWLAVVVLFLVVNLAGVVMAAAMREPSHAGIHVALALLGAYVVWRLTPTRAARRVWPEDESAPHASPADVAERLTSLERSVDTVAVEVERIGEGQRFMTRVFAEHGAPPAPGDGAADTAAVSAPGTAPRRER